MISVFKIKVASRLCVTKHNGHYDCKAISADIFMLIFFPSKHIDRTCLSSNLFKGLFCGYCITLIYKNCTFFTYCISAL